MQRWWRPEVGVFLALWLLGLRAGPEFIKDPGVFWHTVVGEHILTTGQLPERDPFSCTFGGQPWVSSQFWLAEIVMAWLHRLGGFDALVLATVTILAGLYAWVARRIIQAGSHWAIAVPIVVLTVLASAYHFHPRPHLATMVLLGWTFARLQDFEAGRASLRGLLWLVPAFALWTNLHGGMLGGLGTVGLTVAGWFLWRLLRRASPVTSWWQAGFLVGLLALLALTALANPVGWRVPATWLHLSRSPVLPRFIDEHMPLNPTDQGGRMVLILAGLYLLTLAGTWPQWPRVTWLLPLVWLVLALGRIRHGPLFSLTAALAIAEMLPQTRWAKALMRMGSDLFGPRITEPFRLTPWALPAIAVVTVLSLQMASVRAPLVGRGWSLPPPRIWPVALLLQLKDLERRHPEGKVLNSMLYGGFLIYYTPQLKVFVDDRCELYTEKFLVEYFTAKDPAEVAAWDRQYQFNIALVSQDSVLDEYLFWTALLRRSLEWLDRRGLDLGGLLRRVPDWHLVGEDPEARARLYERRG